MIDNETAVIASVLKRPKSFGNLYDILKPEHFYWEPYRWAWQALKVLDDSGLSIDAVTLSDELERMGKLNQFVLATNKNKPGRLAVSYIRDLIVKDYSAESYAHLVMDSYAKRQLLIYSGEMATHSINGRKAADIISDFETKVSRLNIFSGKVENHSYDMHAALKNAKEATRNAAMMRNAFECGIESLDEIIAIQKSELVTVAAPTSQGKTALLATAVINSARMGKRWLVFTLEGGHVPFTQRLISQTSGIETWRIMRGRILPEETDKYEQAIQELESLNIQVIDIPSIKIGQIKVQARKKEYDCIGVDYIQLAHADKKNERRDLDIGEVTSGLKALAMELNIPVIQLAQLNRTVESRSERKPGLYDLKESSSIENDSDTVIFIYRPDKVNINNVQLIVAKHRNGKTGEIDAIFIPSLMRFEDATTTNINFNKPRY